MRSVLDDMHHVRIVCDGPKHPTLSLSHPTRPGRQAVTNVAMFWHDMADNLHHAPGQWRQSRPLSGRSRPVDTRVDMHADGTDAWETWVHEVLAAPAQTKPDLYQLVREKESAPEHLRWDLRCPLARCRQTVPVRDEKLQPLLSQIDAAGWHQINLAGLGRLLDGSVSFDDLARLAAILN